MEKKQARKYRLGTLVYLLLLSGCSGTFPLVGFDRDGNPIMERVNADQYSDNLAQGLISVRKSVIPTLNAKTSAQTKWKLRTAVVGLGVNVEGGIGPFKMAVAPRIRAAFATGNKPPIP